MGCGVGTKLGAEVKEKAPAPEPVDLYSETVACDNEVEIFVADVEFQWGGEGSSRRSTEERLAPTRNIT